MRKFRDIIKEYLEETITSKKNMRRRIYQLEEENKELKLSIKDVIKQKDKYKEKLKKQKRKEK